MPALTINGRTVEAREGEVVLSAALRHGIHIAHFCWHPELSIVAQCRACLVEVEGQPKLQPACNTAAREGMVVRTHSPRAAAAQEGVFEFLLFNHPLDCPVCDQGGECPLQDQTMAYAKGRTRSHEPRRVYEKRPISPYIEPEMKRCVHCSRCIRFSLEVDGGGEFGFVGRGDHTVVGTFEGRPLTSAVSGNVIDICPVGALTDKKYRFTARVWEMRDTPNPCALCGVGCASRVWTREGRIMRVTAGENGAVNDCWVCDVGRFGWSAAESGARLREPLVREGGRLVPASWGEALERVASGLREALRAGGPWAVGAIGGARATCEASYALGRLFRGALGTNNLDCRLHPRERAQSEAQLAAFGRTGWEAPLAGLDSARCVFLAGLDPFEELPILALRIRKAHRRAGATLLSAHTRRVDLRVSGGMGHLLHRPGAEAHLLRAVARCAFEAGAAPEGPGGEAYRRALGRAKLAPLLSRAGVEEAPVRGAAEALLKGKPAYLLGGPGLWEEAACRELVNLALLTGAHLGFAHLAPNLQGALDMGLHPHLLPGHRPLGDGEARRAFEAIWGRPIPEVPGMDTPAMLKAAERGEMKALYLLGCDPAGDHPEGAFVRRALAACPFVVVQDSLPSPSQEFAHVVLPAATAYETEGSLTNFERRIQRLRRSRRPRGSEAREDWEILGELTRSLAGTFGFPGLAALQREVGEVVPAYRGLAELPPQGRRWGEEVRGSFLEVKLPGEGPPLPSEFPLRLLLSPSLPLSGSLAVHACHLWEMKSAALALNPEDLRGLGLAEGARARLETGAGAASLPVRADRSLPRGAALAPEGFVRELLENPLNLLWERGSTWVPCRVRAEG